MLKVYFGSLPNENYNVDAFFDFNFKSEWFDDELNKEMILDVDKSKVIARNIIESPVLGTIPPQWLSGGVKTLILLNSCKRNDVIFNGSQCGDNCAKWILHIAKMKDITLTFHHVMNFGLDTKFDAYIINNGKYTKNMDEFLEQADIILSGIPEDELDD